MKKKKVKCPRRFRVAGAGGMITQHTYTRALRARLALKHEGAISWRFPSVSSDFPTSANQRCSPPLLIKGVWRRIIRLPPSSRTWASCPCLMRAWTAWPRSITPIALCRPRSSSWILRAWLRALHTAKAWATSSCITFVRPTLSVKWCASSAILMWCMWLARSILRAMSRPSRPSLCWPIWLRSRRRNHALRRMPSAGKMLRRSLMPC